jgi:hypothetical protein
MADKGTFSWVSQCITANKDATAPMDFSGKIEIKITSNAYDRRGDKQCNGQRRKGLKYKQ